MALSNPTRTVVEAIAGEALEHGDVVHLIMEQSNTSDGHYSAVKYDSADADILIGTYGVVDSGVDIASGDQVSCVVAGMCDAKVFSLGLNITVGMYLLIADGGTTTLADGTFCTTNAHSDAGALSGNLDDATKRLVFQSWVRAQVLHASTITATATVNTIKVRVFNNPATPG